MPTIQREVHCTDSNSGRGTYSGTVHVCRCRTSRLLESPIIVRRLALARFCCNSWNLPSPRGIGSKQAQLVAKDGRITRLSESGQGRVERDSVAPQANPLPAGPIFSNALSSRSQIANPASFPQLRSPYTTPPNGQKNAQNAQSLPLRCGSMNRTVRFVYPSRGRGTRFVHPGPVFGLRWSSR